MRKINALCLFFLLGTAFEWPSSWALSNEDAEHDVDAIINFIFEDVVDNEAQLVKPNGPMAKRAFELTMDFNGRQVSLPTWGRLNRMQKKVFKLKKILEDLHFRYDIPALQALPKYRPLMEMYDALKPILPPGQRELNLPPGVVYKRSQAPVFAGPEDVNAAAEGSSNDVEMPKETYRRLVRLQEKVLRLDQMIRYLKAKYPIEELRKVPEWSRMLELRSSLDALVPQDRQGYQENKR